jgi:hypothetical protein
MEESPDAEVFQSYEWVTAWLDVFWDDKPINFVFVTAGQALRAVAPFIRDEFGELCCRGSLALPFNSKGCSDILYVGNPRPTLDALFHHIEARERPLRVNLGNVRKNSDVSHALDQIVRDQRLWSVLQRSESWAIASLNGSWRDYLQSRSRRVRGEIRRKEARARRAASVTLRVVTDADALEAALVDIASIENRSWRGDRGLAISLEPGRETFYPSVVRRVAPTGRLRIYILDIDGVPAAHLIAMTSKGEIQALTTAYDQAFGELSPGSILFSRALRDACENGYRAFNFLTGNARWKSELASGTREYVERCIFSRVASSCGYCLLMHGYVKPFFRRNLPGLVAAKNRLISRKPG